MFSVRFIHPILDTQHIKSKDSSGKSYMIAIKTVLIIQHILGIYYVFFLYDW